MVLNLAAALVENQSCELNVVSFVDGPLVQKLKRLGVDSRVVPVRSKFDILKILQLARLMRGRYDIVHSHGARACFFANLAAKLVSLRTVATIHQAWDVKSDRWVDRFGKWVDKIVISWFSDYRIYVSQALYDEIEPQCFSNRSGRDVIPNCVEGRFLKFDRVKAAESRQMRRIENGISDSSIVIGCVGRLHRIKGQNYLIESIALLTNTYRDLILVVVGAGPEESAYRDLVAKLGLARRVVFIAEVEDCASWYPCFDILVVPSLSESFGLVALEGYCFGLPVVITDCPGLVEVLGSYSKVFVVGKGSAAEIARGIDTVIAGNYLSGTAPEGEIVERLQRFSIDRFGGDHSALYQTLIGAANAMDRYPVGGTYHEID